MGIYNGGGNLYGYLNSQQKIVGWVVDLKIDNVGGIK